MVSMAVRTQGTKSASAHLRGFMQTSTDVQLILASPNRLELFALDQLAARIPNVQVGAIVGTALEMTQAIRELRPQVVVMDAEFGYTLGRIRDLSTRFLLLATSFHLRSFSGVFSRRVCAVLDRSSEVGVICEDMRRVVGCTQREHGRDVCENCPLPGVRVRMVGDNQLPLSKREMQVFLMIGRGLSVAAIARELNLSVKTVETHRDHIKRKLGIASASDLLWMARRWQHVAQCDQQEE